MFGVYRSFHLISKIFDARTSKLEANQQNVIENIVELSSAFDGRTCFVPTKREKRKHFIRRSDKRANKFEMQCLMLCR